MRQSSSILSKMKTQTIRIRLNVGKSTSLERDTVVVTNAAHDRRGALQGIMKACSARSTAAESGISGFSPAKEVDFSLLDLFFI